MDAALPKLGLFSLNTGACARPEGAAAVARLAEEAGYESLWVGEHVVLPDPRVAPSPMDPGDPMVDPVVMLSFLAAHTSRVRLGTGIIILPQRNPVVLAKELASLDVLSGGRLLFGVGVGYLEPEFRALGAPFEERAAVAVENLDAMEALWYQERPSFEGRWSAFSGIDAHPRPVQRPVPLVMGGHSPPAYRRAVERCSGWYGFALDLERTAACIAGLRRAEDEVERREGLGPLEITVTPRARPSVEVFRRYRDLGVDRLVLLPGQGDLDAVLAFVREHAPAG